MAVVSATLTPQSFPTGQSAAIEAVFQTAPATPDEPGTVTITQDGVTRWTGNFTQIGTPAEAVPAITVGSTGAGWEIQATNGTLVAVTGTPNHFTVS